MKNFRSRVSLRFVTYAKDSQKLVSKPSSVSQKIFNKDLVAVHKIKDVLALDKPAYLGMCILDLN